MAKYYNLEDVAFYEFEVYVKNNKRLLENNYIKEMLENNSFIFNKINNEEITKN